MGLSTFKAYMLHVQNDCDAKVACNHKPFEFLCCGLYAMYKA